MALKSCRSCGHQVARGAKACPSCGQKNPARRTSWWALGLILVVGIGVVASMDTGTAPAASGAAANVACETVPTELAATIASTLTVEGGGGLGRTAAVRSGAHQDAYFVAAEITGPGMDGTQGVWFKTGALGEPGMIFSVDNVAKEFSQLGDASRTVAQATMGDAGASEARECLSR